MYLNMEGDRDRQEKKIAGEKLLVRFSRMANELVAGEPPG